MRLVVALVMLLGCRKAGDFDTVSTQIVPEAIDAGIVIEEPVAVAVNDPTLGTAPPSKPTGTPVAITIVPQKVGDVRVRSLESRGTFEFEYENKNRQVQHNRYELREELQKIEDGHRIFRVTVIRATEANLIHGKPHETTTLGGPYIVGVLAPGSEHPVGVNREDGSEIGGREIEELADLFQFDSGKPNLLVEIVAKRPLRVGESYVLTEDENILYGGGRKVLGDIWFTLVKLDGPIGHYQADMTLHFPVGDTPGAAHARKLRYKVAADVATGKLVELQEIHNTLETTPAHDGKPASRQAETRHLVMKLTYPK